MIALGCDLLSMLQNWRAIRGPRVLPVSKWASVLTMPAAIKVNNLAAALAVPALAALILGGMGASVQAQEVPASWKREFPLNGFEKSLVDYGDILSGGPPRDGIPAIDEPKFASVAEQSQVLAPTEPVVSLTINGEAKAYPLRVLTWHEIANDTIGGVPVAVTYCPLCNTAIVFERRVGGQATTFGVSGKLRHSDMVIYDRLTETWWQQFSGEAIVGTRAGERLRILPSRFESFERFAKRAPDGQVLVPNNPGIRPYGANPYVGYDTASRPFLFKGPLPTGIAPMTRVVRVDGTAWSLPLLQAEGRIETADLVLTREPGQNSALDSRVIADGADVGNVLVQRKTGNGLEDTAYEVTFAFVFKAFEPEGQLIQSL